MSEIAFAYGSTPPFPANIFVNKFFLLAFNFIPTLGCINACPSITQSPFSFSSGSFNMCCIAPISSKPLFNTSSVSLSNVIIYFTFAGNSFILFCFFHFSIEFSLNTFSSFPSKYSLN